MSPHYLAKYLAPFRLTAANGPVFNTYTADKVPNFLNLFAEITDISENSASWDTTESVM